MIPVELYDDDIRSGESSDKLDAMRGDWSLIAGLNLPGHDTQGPRGIIRWSLLQVPIRDPQRRTLRPMEELHCYTRDIKLGGRQEDS